MPTYAYRCTSCAHQFEAIQKFSDSPIDECPKCGEFTRRVFQPVGIVFKGSGWYINDSRKSESASDKVEKAKTDTKSDDTPKTKSAESASPDKAAPTPPAPKPAPAATAD